MGSPPSNGSDASSDRLEQEAAAPVRQQTVRAYNPMLTEGTVKAPAPTAPAAQDTMPAPMPVAPSRQETVRARVPTPAPIDVQPVEPIDQEPAFDASMLVESLGDDVPVSRSNAPTVPEEAADEPLLEPVPARVEPPAVSGEVSVADPEPLGMFDPRPQRRPRPKTEPAGQAPRPIRDDPQPVSGEVAINAPKTQPLPAPAEINVMTSSGPQPVLSASAMTSSGHHPAVNPATFGQRPGTDPGMAAVPYSDTTGPQPLYQAEATGPHTVMHAGMTKRARRSDRTLWYVALALVVLAVGGVVLVVMRAG